MASLALGLAGAGIGSFFGPMGTSIGWSLGVMVGGRLGHKSHQSPQIKDLRVQTSEYGTPIPIGFGTIRIAGFLEWAADKVPHKKKQGGKGGPKVTTTTYTCSFAVGLLETSFLDYAGTLVNNPIIGILRIWANGRLVWGDGSPADALPMTIYYGTETQLPDPTIEAEEGVGQVSANRGKAYVVFTDLELAQFGDAIPNFTFEVVASGTMGLEYYALWPVDYDYPVNGSIWAHPYLLNGVDSSVSGQLTLHRYRRGNAYGTGTGTELDNVVYYDQSTYDLFGNLLVAQPQVQLALPASAAPIGAIGSMNNGIAYVEWSEAGVDCTPYQSPPDPTGLNSTLVHSFAWMKDGVVTYTPTIDIYCARASTSAPGIGAVWAVQMQLGILGTLVYWNGNVYALASTNFASGEPCIKRYPAPDGAVYTPDHDAIFNLSDYTTDGLTSSAGNLVIGSDGHLYCTVTSSTATPPKGGIGTKLIKLDADLNFVAAWYGPDFGPGGATPIGTSANYSAAEYYGHWIANYATIPEYGGYNFAMYRMTAGVGGASGTFTLVDYIPAEGVENPSMVPALNSPLVRLAGTNLAVFRGGILTLGSGPITLAEMVANVSQHVGYAADEYDVTQLTDLVHGACISQRTSGRAAIEAWQPAYGFGAVESNFTNKFVKWGGDVVATIPDADLGARPYGSDGGDPVQRTLTTDKDLPRTVEVVFLNKAMDYQEGMQYWEGPTKSDTRVALTMALVLTDSEGKAVAENIGVNALVERNKFEFSLPRKYAHLEPTDVIAVNELPVRIVKKDEQGYTHIALEGISTRIGEWIVAPPASQVSYVPQPLPIPIKTDTRILDLPLVTDADASLGYYAAMTGRMAGAWPGAVLFKSSDAGANYTEVGFSATAHGQGQATSILGDFDGGDVFDEFNAVTVRMSPGSPELESSNALGVLNGANVAVLGTAANGWELFQYKNAELISETAGGTRVYQLSGLLRGRRGSEAMIGTHTSIDLFTLLPVFNVEGPGSELGAERLFKGITLGQPLASETAIPFTNNGMALKPYAPCLLGGGRNGAGDITLTWTRRTRIGGTWVDNIDAPLSEDTELYSVHIFLDATRTTISFFKSATTPTVTLTAAEQTGEWGSLQATLYWEVAQVGAYGDGAYTQGTT